MKRERGNIEEPSVAPIGEHQVPVRVPDVPDNREVVGFFIAPEQEQSGAERRTTGCESSEWFVIC